jgi:hypothetical protein
VLRFSPLPATTGERSSGNGGAAHREVRSSMASITSCGNEQEQVAGISALIQRSEERSTRLLWANVQKNERENSSSMLIE